MKARTQIIDHPDALSRLSVLPGKRMPGAGRIEIDDAALDAATRADLEARLNGRYFACGCAEGAIGLTAGVAVAAVALAAGGGGWPSLGLVAVPVAGLLAGKAVGLVRAEARLKETVREIRQKWPGAKRPSPDGWACG